MALSKTQCEEILHNAESFFLDNIIPSHIQSINKASKLDAYEYNPFILRYLACSIDGEVSAMSLAKALFYPRVLGTSINTIFGNQIQSFIANVLPHSEGTIVDGMDIQFVDAEDGRTKYCQVKAGPNTINKDDVKTIVDHFQKALNLSRTNKMHLAADDFVLGILYGTTMSANYRKIQEQYPVYTGQEFWYHLTGDQGFYKKLCEVFANAALRADTDGILKRALDNLMKEVQASDL